MITSAKTDAVEFIVDGAEPLWPIWTLIRDAALARELSAPTVNEIVRERRGVTTDMAIRLGRYFDTSATDYSLAATFAADGE